MATRLVLANAVYLKAAWAFPFPGHATSDALFYPGTDGATAGDRDGQLTVQMMRLTAGLDYLRADAYQAVLLPYQASRLAMAVVLPDGPLSALAPRLDGGLGPRSKARPARAWPSRCRSSASGLASA